MRPQPSNIRAFRTRACYSRQHRTAVRSARQRLLGADDAELVALRIGHNGPSLVASLTDIEGSCPETDEAIDLRFTFRGAGLGTWIEIEMHTILATLSSVLGMKQMPIAPTSAEPMTTSRWRSERMGQSGT